MFFSGSGKKKAGLSDSELIALYVKTEDGKHVAELFERYSTQIYAICRRYLDGEEARDAAMEVFEYLLKELKKYEVRNFKSWLARSTSNFCLMRIRKAKTESGRYEEYKKSETDLMESDMHPHHKEEDDKEAALQALESALEGLGEEQKTCLELFYLRQKSYDEVCEITGFTYKQVKSYIQNGKRNLKKQLSEGNG